MSCGEMHKNEVDASLICHETLNPTYQLVYNLDLDSLRFSLEPRKKIRAKRGRAKGINSIQDGAVPYGHSLIIEGDSACRIVFNFVYVSQLMLQCLQWSVTELLKSLENGCLSSKMFLC